MATFADFKEDVTIHKGIDRWVYSTTSTNEIYYKLIASDDSLNRKIVNYPDTQEIKTNLIALASIVSALVNSFGEKIHINSGYRCHAINTAVGGAKGSQHLTGEAVDLGCKDAATKAKLWIFLLNSPSWKNKVDQMIWENNGAWVHCSFKCKNPSDISSDASYSPRSYSNQNKIYWMPKPYDYINIWSSTYKRTNTAGYVYFVDVPGLQGVEFDGKTFQVDYSLIASAEGSILSGLAGNYSSGGVPLEQNYGGSVSRGANKITNLFKARNRSKGTDPNVDETRKKDFESLVSKMIEEAPGLGRDIVQSPEMYDTPILKGDQVSKKTIN